jgi:hypothetical protein
MPTLSLDAIQQRITQHDSELQALRKELDARRSRLQALSNRKKELQDQLQRIESEMAAVATGTQRAAASSSKSAQKAAPNRPASKPSQPPLADLIVAILQDAGRVLSVQQITQEVKQRGFPSKSKALHRLVGKNVYALATKGVIRRTKDFPAAFGTRTGAGKSPTTGAAKSHAGGVVTKIHGKAAKAPGSGQTKANHKSAANGAGKPTSGPKTAPQTPLRAVLEQILRTSGKPMAGGELATAAVKAGYKSKSKRLVDNIWTALGNMKNVENIKGQGYRLKRST